VKTINTLDAYIKFGIKLFHWTWKKRVKCKTCHRKIEEKGEFGNPRNESLYFKEGTLIMVGPDLWMLEDVHDIFAFVINILEIN